MALFIDSKSNEMIQMKVFAKDGGRYTLKINKLIANGKYADDTFVFDETEYPDIYIEDLRID